jgi:serine/threonine protein kinase
MIITAKGRKSGQTYRLSQEIAAGGEGRIYDVPDNDRVVAKIYKIAKLSPDRSEKLEIMVAHPPADVRNSKGHPTIAFPTDVLEYTGKSGAGMINGQVIGYVMPKLRSHMKKIFNFSDSRSRLSHNPFFTYDYLMNTAINFVTAVNTIHESNYVIGDINESNIMVDKDKTYVTLIDADSFQVEDPKNGQVYRCPVGKIEYTPPELQGEKFENVTRSSSHDLFGMAVIIYQILMENAHPFSGVYQGSGESPEYGKSIKQGFFVHKKKTKSPYKLHSTALPFETLNPDIQTLFLRCFEDGHTNPSARPTAKEWRSVLRQGKKSLAKCNKNANHYFGDHLPSCPWCERAQNLSIDPFPATQAEVQRILQTFQKKANQKRSNVKSGAKTKIITPKPVINSFQANTTSIKEGQSLILSWHVANAQSVNISPGLANLSGSGSITVSPKQNTNYILTATAYGKSATRKIRVKVEAKPEVTFKTSADAVPLGHPVTLSWDVAPNYSVALNNGIGNVGNHGKITVTPVKYFWGLLGIRSKRNIVYVLTATNRQKRIRQRLKIGILMPDSPPELAKYISLSSSPIPLNYQSISLSSFINLNQVTGLFKDYIGLLRYTYLLNHSWLKEISVSIADYTELLRDRKASNGKSGLISGILQKLL